MECQEHRQTVVTVHPLPKGRHRRRDCDYCNSRSAAWVRQDPGTEEEQHFCKKNMCRRAAVPETDGEIPEGGGTFCCEGPHKATVDA